MGYTSKYAQSMMGGKDKPAKTRSSSSSSVAEKPKISTNGKSVRTDRFTRQDAKDWKKEHGTPMSVRKIKKNRS